MTLNAPGTSPGRAGPAARASIAARFERLPLCRWHVTVRLIVGAVTFFEAFDQLLIAYAMPELRAEWQLSTSAATLLLTVGSVGMLIGALLSGRLADRIGRVKVIALCVAVSSVANLALAVAPSADAFMGLRVLQGLAIGGEVPVAATFIAEITRSHRRGRFVLLYELVFPAGLTVGALVAAWVVPLLGWRWMYVIAAVPGLLCVLVQKKVPESPRWLADHGRTEDAAATMARIENEVERITGKPLPPVGEALPVAPPGTGASGLRGLFTGRYRRRTLVIGALWFTGYFVNYGITSWLPTIYQNRYDLSLSDALLYSTVTSCAGLLGCLLAALTVDRAGRRKVITCCLGGAAAVLLLLARLGAHTPAQVLIWTSLAAVFFFGSNICLYLYTPELFPTRMRALGSSVGGALNRLGVILGPIVVGAVYAGGRIGTVFLVLGAVALAGAVVAGLGAEETAGRRLEEVSP
ncbi:MFS transporter [Streptomyces sp. SID14478]|uniref:MFS transporter n=1 Tax=Streptomyces sp. SID14478 TaxID=2706073 RepID=UPI0013DBE89C|nr:MFS transporter [Streptomyces sp. SID14478]NEB74767.1 MFS transporter [Streptomyces sp. SID14478]